MQSTGVINNAAEIGKSVPLQSKGNSMTRCKECHTPLIITPDETKCCPRCGLVVGKGYSWMGTEAPRDESMHVYEHHGEAYGC